MPDITNVAPIAIAGVAILALLVIGGLLSSASSKAATKDGGGFIAVTGLTAIALGALIFVMNHYA